MTRKGWRPRSLKFFAHWILKVCSSTYMSSEVICTSSSGSGGAAPEAQPQHDGQRWGHSCDWMQGRLEGVVTAQGLHKGDSQFPGNSGTDRRQLSWLDPQKLQQVTRRVWMAPMTSIKISKVSAIPGASAWIKQEACSWHTKCKQHRCVMWHVNVPYSWHMQTFKRMILSMPNQDQKGQNLTWIQHDYALCTCNTRNTPLAWPGNEAHENCSTLLQTSSVRLAIYPRSICYLLPTITGIF